MFEKYLNKYNKTQSLIGENPKTDLYNIIVIPCLDEPDILDTLKSLKSCELPKKSVEVIVVINSSEIAPEETITQNKKTYKEVMQFAELNNNSKLSFYPILIKNVHRKKAGAGFARKLGMDEAIFRFNSIKTDGVITNIDADTLVENNYLIEIEKAFIDTKTNAVSIYFEHNLNKDKYGEKIIKGIKKYELYLRYFKQALKFINFPFATHTIGSAFAVKASSYVQVGGMKATQAGEDFYFIQKAIQTGNYEEIVTTKVFPSPRLSERVIFGTGPAVIEILKNDNSDYFVYSIASFIDLKQFIDRVNFFFKADDKLVNDIIESCSPAISAFLLEIKFSETISKINSNTKTKETFIKAFYNNFNTFSLIRFLNESHKKNYNLQEVEKASRQLLNLSENNIKADNLDELLNVYKKADLEELVLFG